MAARFLKAFLLSSSFSEDAYSPQPFFHPDRCLRRCPGPQPVRLPAPHIQAAQQRIARQTLLPLRVGVGGRGEPRETQHAGEDSREPSPLSQNLSWDRETDDVTSRPQGDAGFGGSRSIKNLRRSNSTTQVSQQTGAGFRYWCNDTVTPPLGLLILIFRTTSARRNGG